MTEATSNKMPTSYGKQFLITSDVRHDGRWQVLIKWQWSTLQKALKSQHLAQFIGQGFPSVEGRDSRKGIQGQRKEGKELNERTGAVLTTDCSCKGMQGQGPPALSSYDPRPYGEFCLTLGPFYHSTLAHQRPRHPCLLFSRRFLGFRHLATPSSRSLPCAFAKPETWKPRLVSVLSRTDDVTTGAWEWLPQHPVCPCAPVASDSRPSALLLTFGEPVPSDGVPAFTPSTSTGSSPRSAHGAQRSPAECSVTQAQRLPAEFSRVQPSPAAHSRT